MADKRLDNPDFDESPSTMGNGALDARESKGLVNRPQAEVKQDFGDKQTTNTSGGDAAGGNLDKSTQINLLVLLGGNSVGAGVTPSLQPLSQLLGQLADPNPVRQAYRDALPADAGLSRPEVTNYGDMVAQLQEFRRLPEFVQRLVQDEQIPQVIRNQLKDTTQQLSQIEGWQQVGVDPKASPKILQSYLQIVLSRENNSDRLRVNAWLIPDDTVINPGSAKGFEPLDLDEQQQGASCGIEDVPKIVDQLLELSRNSLYGKRHILTIEVFLPLEYLCADVDGWISTEDLGFTTEQFVLGTKYCVIVRSQERLNPKYLKSRWNQWHDNWDRVKPCLDTAPNNDDFEHLDQFECCDWEQLISRLKQKLGLKLTCGLVAAHKKDMFTAILRAASPIGVWTRCHLPHLDSVSAINQLMQSRALRDLAEAVRDTRERASIAEVPNNHLGCHLAILWEDPHRLTPDVMVRLGQSGGDRQ